jgi:Putative peptidoglycan binding domain
MRTFLILVCSLALVCSAGAAQNDNKSKKQAQKNRQTQSTQYARPAGGPKKATPKRYQPASTARSYQKAAPKRYQPTSTATSYQKTKARQGVNNQVYQSRSNVKTAKKGSQQIAAQNAQAERYATKKTKQARQGVNNQVYQSRANVKTAKKNSQQIAAQNAQSGRYATTATYNKKTKQWKGNTASAAAFQSNGKKYKAQRFNLASNTRPTNFTAVKFQQNRRIQGSQYWQGKNYWAFRDYRPVWHDRIWWRSHYNRVVFVYGGWYYWNSGWWYPAWGYAPNAYYAYDGPIYGYNSLPPDQVIANVQAALQEQGYYQGEVDGLLGPLTRTAIADYQRNHGLYETAAIDQPTLESLGMT